MNEPAPGDRDGWAVYADWLTSRGDARGEVLNRILRVEAKAPPGWPQRDIWVTEGLRQALLGDDLPACARWVWRLWMARDAMQRESDRMAALADIWRRESAEWEPELEEGAHAAVALGESG